MPTRITVDTPNVEFAFFWSGVFSQWHPVSFYVSVPHPYLNITLPVKFNTNEQYMMLCKALLFDDYDTARAIMNTDQPNEQKALGRRVKNFDDARWRDIAKDVVLIGNLARFYKVESSKKHLLSTGNKLLVEASPKDSIWGIGMSDNHPDVNDPSKWLGINWLGICETEAKELINLVESDPVANVRLAIVLNQLSTNTQVR